MNVETKCPLYILHFSIWSKVLVQNIPKIHEKLQPSEIFKNALAQILTYQKMVAISNPTPMQSMNITYNRKTMNCRKPNLRTMANTMDDTEIQNYDEFATTECNIPQSQAANRTKKAGSSLANCDFVSKIKMVISYNYRIYRSYAFCTWSSCKPSVVRRTNKTFAKLRTGSPFGRTS